MDISRVFWYVLQAKAPPLGNVYTIVEKASIVKPGYYGIKNQTISFRNNQDSGINRYY
jgi:hypothetical protein